MELCRVITHPQGQEFYPLGKPNKRPLAAAGAHKKKKAEKKPSSFFDFLIPSFVRGASSKADREGPVMGKVVKKYPAVPGKKRRTGMLTSSSALSRLLTKSVAINVTEVVWRRIPDGMEILCIVLFSRDKAIPRLAGDG